MNPADLVKIVQGEDSVVVGGGDWKRIPRILKTRRRKK
jgi:hypothetical protein